MTGDQYSSMSIMSLWETLLNKRFGLWEGFDGKLLGG